MSTLLLNRNAVNTLIRMADVINVVEEAFRMCGEGKGNMPAKALLAFSEMGHFLYRTLWHNQAELASSLRLRL